MNKLRTRLSQLAELPRYVLFVRSVCGVRIAALMAWGMVTSAPAILRSGTLRAVDAHISAMTPPVRVGGVWTRWHRIDFGLFRDILLRRVYRPDSGFTPHAGDVIVDLGANVGAFSILAAAQMGRGRVIAVEAQAYEYEMLIRNIELNQAGAIVTPLLGFAGGGGLFEGTEYESRIVNLNEVVERYEIRDIALLKVDIEGSEFALFGARPAWLGIVRRIAMEVHPPYGSVDGLADLLRSEGFAVRTHPSSTPDTAVYLYAVRDAIAQPALVVVDAEAA